MIIIKQSPSIQVAHLYEHLFCKSIDNFFRANGLFRSLDYSLYGTTHPQGGIVSIRIDFHSEKAARVTEKITSLEIDLDEASIGIGISQIIAEIEKPLASSGVKKVKYALQDLHNQPWQNIDDLEYIDTRNIDLKNDVLAINESEAIRVKNRDLIVNLALNPAIATTQPELLPLFFEIVDFIMQNSQKTLINSSGLYGVSRKKIQNEEGFNIPFIFKVPPHGKTIANNRDYLTQLLWIFIDCARAFRKDGTIKRFAKALHRTSYDEMPYLMPHPDTILKNTCFFVGTKGWRKIATEENCNLLLDNTAIEIKYGRKRIDLRVKKEAW